MPQHDALSPERWNRFSLDQQILMIGNEMNRASKLMGPENAERRHNAYERVLALTDLTIGVHTERGLRRELLRWRDLIAELYAGTGREGRDPAEPAPAIRHAAAFRALLRFTPEASRQIPHLLVAKS